MKEALYYTNEKGKLRCVLCPNNCFIPENKTGACKVRKNIGGKLYSLVYNKPCSINIDPIEKKPLFHFHPGSEVFSAGTFGCNLFCKGCQNWTISRAEMDEQGNEIAEVTAEEIIQDCERNRCKIIAFTYNEPTIFYEYMIDIAKLAKKKGIKCVIVSNGYINEKPLRELCKYIDAANIDLKGFSSEFYLKWAKAKFENILKTLKILKEEKVWVEVTNLLVPDINDNPKEIEKMCKWVAENLGKDTPLHFSRFFPYHEAKHIDITPLETLEMAKKIGDKYLNYVYVGNISTGKYENTYCPKCNELLIKRNSYYDVSFNKIKDGKCPKCHHKINGIWD